MAGASETEAPSSRHGGGRGHAWPPGSVSSGDGAVVPDRGIGSVRAVT